MIKLKNFSNYEIYPELGKVWSIKRKKWVGSKSPSGYWLVSMYDDNGTRWMTSVHRVIWTAVYGDIPEGYEINHKSERKDENFISNLELCTHKENMLYGTRTARVAEKQKNDPNQSKPVARCDLQGNVLEIYPSLKETRRQGYTLASVHKCCNGKRKSHKGFIWRYAS